jgi:hypothetical protein
LRVQLEFAVEFALGLAHFAGEALEGFLLVDAGFGLQAGALGGDGFAGGFPSLVPKSERPGAPGLIKKA